MGLGLFLLGLLRLAYGNGVSFWCGLLVVTLMAYVGVSGMVMRWSMFYLWVLVFSELKGWWATWSYLFNVSVLGSYDDLLLVFLMVEMMTSCLIFSIDFLFFVGAVGCLIRSWVGLLRIIGVGSFFCVRLLDFDGGVGSFLEGDGVS